MDGDDELIGLGGDDREGLEAATVRSLPRVPDAGEGKGPGFGERDGEDALDGLHCLSLFRGRRSAEEISQSWRDFLCFGFGIGCVRRRDRMSRFRPLVQAAGRDQAAALGEGFAPHLAIEEPVRLSIDRRECFEFVFALGEPWHDAPAHHHQLALVGFTAPADDRLPPA
jgi:hypothetical protein